MKKERKEINNFVNIILSSLDGDAINLNQKRIFITCSLSKTRRY